MDDTVIAAELAKLSLWGQPGIDSGIRAGFKCEYCGRDLLASLDDYKAWAQDHIVPRSRGGANTLDNMAVSCHPCNSAYKKDWDPRSVTGAGATRGALIEATRLMIAQRRADEQVVLDQVRSLVDWTAGE